MADPRVQLLVGGRRYEGWKSVRVTRSIESISGDFELGVSDRWGGQGDPWPIGRGDECRVRLADTVVIDGYVDRRSISLSGQDRTLSYAGRDRAAQIVDASAILDRWAFKGLDLLGLAKRLCGPFNVKVSLDPRVILPIPPPAKTVIQPGDTVYSALEQAARAAGVLLVSDGSGGIVITRSGSTRAATDLVEGENILAISLDDDGVDRFHKYVVATQTAGSDTTSADATRIKAEATDEGVRFPERQMLVIAEKGISAADARRRADWEARIRAARGQAVSVLVRGWEQSDGSLWPLNALIGVHSPGVGVDGDLLIAESQHSIDESGEVTQLRLVRPDAFAPEPAMRKTPVVRESGWPELKHGALGP